MLQSILPSFFHVIIVQNINILELIIYYSGAAGIGQITVPNIIILGKSHPVLLQFRYVLRNSFPDNKFIGVFLDLERRLLSYFIIFGIASLFLPTKKYFNKNFRAVINFGKMAILILFSFYIYELYFTALPNVFSEAAVWFKMRAVEGLSGPIIIITCFGIDLLINFTKKITIYLKNNNTTYQRLLRNRFFSIFGRIEIIFICFDKIVNA